MTEVEPPKPLTARAAAIVKEWNDGASASDLADRLKVTRSSILGTIHRARAAGHHVVKKGATGHSQREVAPKPRPRRPENARVPLAAPPKINPEAISANAGKFADRQLAMRAPGAGEGVPFLASGSTCQWPLWGIEAKTGNVCGRPWRVGKDRHGDERPLGPYCEYHHGKAYPGAR